MGDWRGNPNPYDDVLAGNDKQAAAGSIVTSTANPDQAARANVIARQNGLPNDTVMRNLAQFEREAVQKSAIRDVHSSDYLSTFYANPDNAAAAFDDTAALKNISDTFHSFWAGRKSGVARDANPGSDAVDPLQSTITRAVARDAATQSSQAANAGGFFRRAWAFGQRGISSLESGLYELGGALQDWDANNPLPWTSKANTDLARSNAAQLRTRARLLNGVAPVQGETPWAAVKAKPSVGNIASFGIEQTLQSAPSMAAAMYAMPALIASQMGSFGQARAQNNNREDATLSDVVKASPFAVGTAFIDRLGIGRVLGAAGSNAAVRIAKGVGTEILTQGAQGAAQYTGETVGTDKGFQPADFLDQTIQSAVTGAFLGGGMRGVHEGVSQAKGWASALAAANQSRAGGEVLDSLMSGAEASKLRTRDPEAFRQFIDGQTQGTPVENIYIPAEAIRSLNQDYANDSFFGDYHEQISEALKLDGDVVLPTSDVAARLAGSPAWEALREEARFSPGGMSEAELKSLEAEHGDSMARIGYRIAEEMTRASEAAEPANQVYSKVRQQLADAGFAPDAADRYAQLWAANRETWGARLGTDALAYHMANPVEFKRIMPEALSRVQASDGLDLVINAMKGGKDALTDRQKFGPSLLEWIAARGGIEDGGGDIASMGGDAWHKGKRFTRKLIRPSDDARQASMLGDAPASGHGHDDTLQAAIEAGYFPELKRDHTGPVDGTTFADKPNTQHLLDAIQGEIHGTPRYSHDAVREDHDSAIRTAADELRGMLHDRGIDPNTASKAEIQKAIDGHQHAAGGEADVRAFQQSGNEVTTAEGIPIARGPEAVEAFKRWFGDSKAATANGAPITLFHGTDANFEAFDKARRGSSTKDADARLAFFLNDDPGVASQYADVNERDGQNVVPAVISLQDPLVLDMKGADYDPERFREALLEARHQGKDGAIFRNVKDGTMVGDVPSTTYAVFEPSQIKSVHNRGTFDSSDPRILHQGADEGPRGVIKFGPGRVPVIELFASSDLSTVIHEGGHLWLEELKANAERPDAPADVRADWETTRQWFADQGHAVGDDGIIPTGAHEAWAQGWERYAMEGKAPTSALRSVFDAFRGWLLQIYKHVANIGGPIDPQMREVFDRMLATQDAIDEENTRQHIRLSFDRAQLGMTEGEYAALQKSAGEARGEAFDALLYKTMDVIRRERTKAWKDEERSVRDTVTDNVNSRPEFRALELLRNGKWLGEPDREGVSVKLDRGWLVQKYGTDALALLPKGKPIYSEHGADADLLAEMVGFRSGDEMVRSLMGIESIQAEMRAHEDKRSVRARTIAEETQTTMRERHGDPLKDGSIQEEALAAIHNDRQGELIAAEARALARQRGDVPTPYRLARDWASRKIAEGLVNDVASRSALQRYARAAAKASRLAEAAAQVKDIDEAFRQKQAQLLNHALLAEAKIAADSVDKIVDRLGKIAKQATRKSVDQEHWNRALELLEGFDMRSRSQSSIDSQARFEAWSETARANGVDVMVPPRFDPAKGTHYSRISVEMLKALDDAVRQQIHLGRFKQKLIDEKEARDFSELRGDVMTVVDALPKVKIDANIETWGSKAKHAILGAHAAMTKMGRMIDVLDGGNPNGPLNKHVWRPLADALARENDIMLDVSKRHGESLKQVPPEILKTFHDKVTIPEMPGPGGDTTWSRMQMHQMARNAGTVENWRKLAEGRGWEPSAAFAALDREMTASEWQYVQRDLDLVNSFWPEIQSLYERINGVAPPKVEAKAIETRHGTFAGGYYPLVADKLLSPDIAQKAGAADDIFGSNYTRSTTRNGFVNERTGATYPVSLTPGISQRHIMEVVHDFTHREAIMQADKILSDRSISGAIRAAIGPEMQGQFRPWLKHIANQHTQDTTGVAALEAIANKARTSMSIMGMGYRISTMLQQVAGYSNSIEALGDKGEVWLASGMKSVAGMGLKESFDFAAERSGVVRHRMNQVDQTQAHELEKLQGKVGLAADARRFAYHGIGYMDRVVMIPTWHAGYNKGVAEGMSEADAVALGDKAVEASQGGAGAMNAAAIQRKQGLASLMVMFFSYGSAYYNRQSPLARDWGGAVRDRKTADLPRLMARTWWLMLAPNMISSVIQQALGQGPADDENYAAWLAAQSVAGVFTGLPVVGGVVKSLVSGFDFQASPLDRAGTTVINAAKDIWHSVDDYVGLDPDYDTHASKRAVRNSVETLGYATSLPLGQAAPAAQFLTDWANGDAHPETVSDWYRGLLTGKAEKK